MCGEYACGAINLAIKEGARKLLPRGPIAHTWCAAERYKITQRMHIYIYITPSLCVCLYVDL